MRTLNMPFALCYTAAMLHAVDESRMEKLDPVSALDQITFEHFFGFRKHPFDLLPDNFGIMLLPSQIVARNDLVAAIKDERRVIGLTGPKGIGKTITLENALFQLRGDQAKIVRMKDFVCADLDQVKSIPESIGYNHASIIFVIDDVHTVPRKVLEVLSSFPKIFAEQHVVLQMILVGPTDFFESFRTDILRNFYKMIEIKIRLLPLQEDDLADYIAMRLNLAGQACARVMTSRAVKLLVGSSHGIPGRLNKLALPAFRSAFYNNRRRVQVSDVKAAINNTVRSLPQQKNNKIWIFGAAGVVVLCGIGWYSYTHKDKLGWHMPVPTTTMVAARENPIKNARDSEKIASKIDAPKKPSILSVAHAPILPTIPADSEPFARYPTYMDPPPDLFKLDEAKPVTDEKVSQPANTEVENPNPINTEQNHIIPTDKAVQVHKPKKKAHVPEFCKRMKPQNQAEIAYMKQVCKPSNTRSDIYFR